MNQYGKQTEQFNDQTTRRRWNLTQAVLDAIKRISTEGFQRATVLG